MNQAPALASQEVVISAPMSFHGSAARIWKLTRLGGDHPAAVIGMGALATVLILLAWCAVLCWYVFFGLLLVPYRLIRRGQRKRKLEDLRHQELLATSTAAVAATTKMQQLPTIDAPAALDAPQDQR